GALAQPGLVLQPQHVADPAHRQSLGWHPAHLVRDEAALACSDCRQTSPGHPPSGARDPVESLPALPWNPCPPSRGISARHHVEYAVGPADASTVGTIYFCVQCPEAWQEVS